MNGSIQGRPHPMATRNLVNVFYKASLVLALSSVVFSSAMAQTWYRDQDNDGFGDPHGPTSSTPQVGYVFNALDCNDNAINQQVWKLIGGTPVSTAAVAITRIAIDPASGTVFCLYREPGGFVAVKKFDGTNWVSLGNPPLNVDFPDLALDSHGVPYISFLENIGGNDKASVMVYNSSISDWDYVGTQGFSPNLMSGAFVSLALDDADIPYVVFATNAGEASVMKYNGTWQNVGPPSITAVSGAETSIVIDNNNLPYIAIVENTGEASVLAFNGATWAQVGTETFPFFNIGGTEVPQLRFDQAGVPYVAYFNNTGAGEVIVKKFAAGAWTQVGNTVHTGSVTFVSLAIDNLGVPNVAFMDDGTGFVVSKKFNGISWTSFPLTNINPASCLSFEIGPDNTPYISADDQAGSSQFATVFALHPQIDLPVISSVTAGQTFLCAGEGTTLQITSAGSTLGHAAQWVWYSGSCGGTPEGNGLLINKSSLSATTTYYVRGEGDCITPAVNCTSLVIGVTQQPSWFIDDDGDGFGDPSAAPVASCAQPTPDHVINNADCNDHSLNAAAAWSVTGTAGFSAPGGGSPGANNISLAFDGNTPFISYRDGGTSSKATVMKYDGTNWVNVGTPGFSAGAVTFTNIALYNSTPYVAYVDATRVSVMKFTGSNWTLVGSAAFSGTTTSVSMAIDPNDGTIYVVYPESGNSKATVMKYNGTAWVVVGASGFTPGTALNNSITIDSRGTPYVAFADGSTSSRLAVMKYNGTSWVLVGTAGLSAGAATFTSIRVDSKGVPYVACRDANNGNKAIIKKFNTSWGNVGSTAEISVGIADNISLALDKSGAPYVAYRDNSVSNKATVLRFDGTSWTALGGAGISVGAAQSPFMAISYNGIPYVAYGDLNAGARATVLKMIPALSLPDVPTITPTSTFLCASGSTSNLDITVGDLKDADHWQWYSIDNSATGGCGPGAGVTTLGTNSSLTISPGGAGTSTRYYVRGEGACVTTPATCQNVIIPTHAVTAITNHPQDAQQCEGTSITFTSASNGANLAYQWKKDGNNISSASNASYTLTGITTAHAAAYTVEVTGSCGTVTSTAADLLVDTSPVITLDPVDIQRCEGANVTFTSTSTGSGKSVQWKKNSADLIGETNDNLTINGIDINDDDTYTLVVKGTCNTTGITRNVDLTVNTNPVITLDPVDIQRCEGANVTFTSTSTGTGKSVQWKKNGADLTGETNENLTINGIDTGDDDTYTLVVKGTCNTTGITRNVDLTVNTNPVITLDPVDIQRCEGANVTFTSTSTGTGKSVQWKKNGADLTGETNDNLTINGIDTGDDDTYTLVVKGTCNTTGITRNVDLTVNTNPVITLDPVDIQRCEGANVTFTSTSTGTGKSVQWQKNGADLTGETNDNLTLNGIDTGDDDTYTLVVKGTCNTTGITRSADLTVNTNPVITLDPVDIQRCEGANVTFTSTSTGSGKSVQWQKNGADLTGETNDNLTINGIDTGDDDTYTLVVKGTCNTTGITRSADLTVNTNPVITLDPVDIQRCEGANVTFTSTSTGSGKSVQWKKNGADLTGETNDNLTINGIDTGDDDTYTLVVKGTCNTTGITRNVDLTVNTNPVITLDPVDIQRCEGANVTFTSTSTGSGKSVQWKKNGADLTGETNDNLTINGIDVNDDDTYTLVVKGTCNTTGITRNVDLTVNTNPVITLDPVDIQRCEGANITFTSTSTGTGKSVQWKKNGTDLPGETNDNLIINGIDATDADTYTLVVKGTCNTVGITRDADLIVNTNPVITLNPIDVQQCQGTNVTFTSASTGSGRSVQWRKNGIDLPGETNDNLTINGIAAGDGSTYTLIVRGTCNTTGISRNAMLTVTPSPAINAQPASRTVCDGASNVTFSATATGDGLSYQWQTNNGTGPWTNLMGQNDPQLVLSSVDASLNNYAYRVVVTGTCNPSVTSAAAALVVNSITGVTLQLEEPAVVLNPPGVSVCTGGEVKFSGTISGTGGGHAYQWQRYDGSNWVNVVGETDATFTLSAITSAFNNYQYRVAAGNPGCTQVTSSATTITVTESGVTQQPGDIVTCEAGNAIFTVQATGTNLAYQWQINTSGSWDNLPGAIANELMLLHLSDNMNGYEYRVIVNADGCTPIISSIAGLQVNHTPELTAEPNSLAICQDHDAVFIAQAEGDDDLTYQWQVNDGTDWAEIPDETSASLMLRQVPVEIDGHQYRVMVSAPGCMPVFSSAAMLDVNTLPGEPGCELTLVVSEGISPNGDNILDYWVIQGIELYPNNHVKLFNVWGDMIFEQKNYDNDTKVWKGQTSKGLSIGQQAPDGTYYYYLNLGNNTSPLRGFVVLKR